MKNSIEKLEEFNFTNEGLWDKIKGTVSSNKTAQYGIFSYTENVGWHVGSNKIENYRNDHSLGFDSPKLEFLTNPHVKFYADTLYISNGKVGFSGIWEAGEFQGDLFFTGKKASIFKGGIFNGGHFDAIWEAHPSAFHNGTVEPGPTLLGVSPVQMSKPLEQFNILSAPVGAFISVTGNKKKYIFQLLKTINENGAELQFKTIPDEKIIKTHWQELIQEYYERVEITAGNSFIIPGVINVKQVSFIEVLTDYKYQPKYKIQLDLGKIKQLSMPYNKIFLTIDANQKRKQEAENLNKSIVDGTFGANLAFLKREIQSAVDAGEANDLADYLLKLRSGKFAGITEEIIDINAKLVLFANLLKQYVDPDVKEKVSKAIQSYLLPKKSVDNSVKNTIQPTTDSSEPIGPDTIKATKNFLKNLE